MKLLVLLLISLLIASCTGGGGAQVDAFLGINTKGTPTPAKTYSLALSDGVFNESASDGGVIDEVIAVSLASQNGGAATFVGNVADDLVILGHAVVTNVPAGLTARLIKQSNTILSFSLSGTAASHTAADDISNMQVTFGSAAFSNVDTGTVAGSIQTLSVSYNALQFNYSTSTFQAITLSLLAESLSAIYQLV